MASGLQGFRASGLQGFRRKSDLLTPLSKFALFTFLITLFCVPASAETVSYREASYSGGKVTFADKTADATVLTSTSTTWEAGTYVAKGFVTIPSRVTVNGTVNLILANGAILTVPNGITVSEGNTLKIYGQKSGSGTLIATAYYKYTQLSEYPWSTTTHGAAIGGGLGTSACGAVEIHGGTVIAQKNNSAQAAGIGGERQGNGGTFIMYGGTVQAEGSSDWCGGISGGMGGTGKGVNAEIYGGSLIAVGGAYNATLFADGIGTGRNNSGQPDHGTLTAGEGVTIWGSADNSTWEKLASPFTTRYRYMKAEGPQDESGSSGGDSGDNGGSGDNGNDNGDSDDNGNGNSNGKAAIGDDPKDDAQTIEGYLNGKDEAALNKITSVKIEDAKSLTSLTGIGSMKNLEKLEIVNCPKLTSGNLSNLTNLKEVSMRDCNAVTRFDVSGCEELVSLDVGNGEIESLNMEGCKKLVSLDCSLNHLTSLNMSNSDFPNLASLICDGQTHDGPKPERSGNVWTVNLSDYVAKQADVMTSGVRVADASKVVSVKSYDDTGTEMTGEYDPLTGTASFKSRPNDVKYWYNTGHNDVLMDVTLVGAGLDPVSAGHSSSNCGNGCNSGFTAAASLLALVLLRRKQR